MEFLNLLRSQWDRAAAIACALAGAIALIVGWIGTSGTEHVAEQMPYIISAGLTGIFLLGVSVVRRVAAVDEPVSQLVHVNPITANRCTGACQVP